MNDAHIGNAIIGILLGLMLVVNFLTILNLAAHGKGFVGAGLWVCGIIYGRFAGR